MFDWFKQKIKDKTKKELDNLNTIIDAGKKAGNYIKESNYKTAQYMASDKFDPWKNKTVTKATNSLSKINTRPLSSNAKSTLGKIAGGIVETPYTMLTSPAKFYGKSLDATRDNSIFTKKGAKKFAGSALETGLDIAGGGVLGKAKSLAKAVPVKSLSQIIKVGAKTGAKVGFGYGAGYGVAQGLQENQRLSQIIGNSAKQGAIGAVTGGFLGGAIPAASGLTRAIKFDRNLKKQRFDTIPERIFQKYETNPGVQYKGNPQRILLPKLKPKTGNFNPYTDVKLPTQTNRPAPQTPEALRQIGKSFPRPGMNIEDISGIAPKLPKSASKAGSPSSGTKTPVQMLLSGKSPLALPAPHPKAPTLRQARSIFKKTGKAVPFVNENKPGSNVIEAVAEGQGYKPLPGDIENIVLGRATYTPQSGSSAGSYIEKTRAVQDWIDKGVSDMAGSSNMLVRVSARFLQGFGSQLGKNRDTAQNLNQYKGGIDWGRELANDAAQKVYSVLPDDKALQRVHSNLDPELYGGKAEKLSPQEMETADYLRQISDWINDTNFANGFISPEQWSKGRDGKYLARAYEPYDYPPEVADLVKSQSAKMDLGMFKKRGELTDWKQENAIKDPAYLVGKRLQQTIFNDTTSKMFNWLKGQADYVSEKPRDGFTQLSDHKAYGEMAGKYVRNDIMEDIKGFFFTNQLADDAYKLLRAYGRNPIRRGLKASKTVLNPVTRLGNRMGNMLFGWLSGINPATFAKNQIEASKMLKSKDPLVTQMMKDGILGTDFSKGEIVDVSADIMRGNKQSILKKFWNKAGETYGQADDVAKVGAMKTFLDRGYSYQEASQRVLNSFQNYRTVGKFYDIGSNMPVLGNAFIRFQADLQRILKNAVVEHPIRAIGTAIAIKTFGDLMSEMSGEKKNDKKLRENRVGSPHIPYTDISLAFQTPWGEVNASRWLGVYSNTPVGGATVSSDASKTLPFLNPFDKRNYGSDVMVGPLISAGMDTDFRGKSIQDPDQNKYEPSTLTTGEKAGNVAKYLGRSYNLPFFNDILDTGSAFAGEKNFYGQKKTPVQALMRLGGVKVEQFGKSEVEELRNREQEFNKNSNKANDSQFNKVLKSQALGEIDDNTANKRLDNISNKYIAKDFAYKKVKENQTKLFNDKMNKMKETERWRAADADEKEKIISEFSKLSKNYAVAKMIKEKTAGMDENKKRLYFKDLKQSGIMTLEIYKLLNQ